MGSERSIFVLAATLLLSGALAALWVAEPAAAQGAAPAGTDVLTGPLPFEIAAQPLDMALVAFARASGLDVLNDNRVTTGRQTAGVHGDLVPLAALEQLLAGTGLKAVMVQSRAVVIVEAGSPVMPAGGAGEEHHAVLTLSTLEVQAQAARIGGTPLYEEYARAACAEIERRVRLIRPTGAAPFAAVLRLWIAPDGRIAHLTWDHSSGNGRMDQAIAQQIQDAPLERPPPRSMPQPLRFEIRLY